MSESGSHAGVTFHVSSYSGTGGGNCVAVGRLGDGSMAVRHSTAPALGPGNTLVFTPAEWDAFVRGVKDGEFDPA
ncbi:MAG: DUF397 domain-containing protein [Pseudonocardia sp.]|nr:DUF397 domain-containing protein [Pseudonocardia sp.]